MDWKKELKRLKLEHIQKTSPDFFRLSGGFKMMVKPYRDKRKQELARCILDWINFSGGEAMEIKKGSFRKIDNKMVWMNAPGKRSPADISAVYRSVNIEIIIQNEDPLFEEIAGGWRLSINSFPTFLDWWESNMAHLTNETPIVLKSKGNQFLIDF